MALLLLLFGSLSRLVLVALSLLLLLLDECAYSWMMPRTASMSLPSWRGKRLAHHHCHVSSFWKRKTTTIRLDNYNGLLTNNPPLHNDDENVQVFDHVFSAEACDLLHDLALDVRRSFVFDRPPKQKNSQQDATASNKQEELLTPLEAALDAVLTALGDPHDVVEYWTRQEYINMDVHADLDEEQLLHHQADALRFPAFGHVLYLSIANEKHDSQQPQALRAPTVVWNTQGIGTTWKNDTIMTTIPAVPGRLLRFPGHALHAVPKPPTRWLLSPNAQEELDAATDEQEWGDWEEEDDDNDDEEEEEEDKERSVILFNTWSQQGPQGVPRDSTLTGLPEGIAMDDAREEQLWLEEQKRHYMQEWNALLGPGMHRIMPNSREVWKPVTVNDLDSRAEKSEAMFLPLMGPRVRRQVSEQFVPLCVSAEQMPTALLEANQPSKVHLAVPEKEK